MKYILPGDFIKSVSLFIFIFSLLASAIDTGFKSGVIYEFKGYPVKITSSSYSSIQTMLYEIPLTQERFHAGI